MDDVGLLDHDDLAAELGLTDGDSLTGFGGGIEPDLSDLEDIGNGGSPMGFADELADLDVPDGRRRLVGRLILCHPARAVRVSSSTSMSSATGCGRAARRMRACGACSIASCWVTSTRGRSSPPGWSRPGPSSR